jgi:hypothetical protein
MMKPPIFPPPPSGTAAQQYMHRARMFRKAAMRLVDSSNGEQFLPKYALLTHAIELSLKAFAFHSVEAGKPERRVPNHDLRGWYQLAIQYGLRADPTITKNINHLHELHFSHYMRYPQEATTPVSDLSVIADSTVDYLIDSFTPLINPS